MFHLLVKVGFLPFYGHDSLSLTRYLVAAESRISKKSGKRDAREDYELCIWEGKENRWESILFFATKKRWLYEIVVALTVAVYSDKIVSDVGEIFRLERSYVKNKWEKMK